MAPIRFIALTLFFLSAATAMQDHAPSIEQCRADVAVWTQDDMGKNVSAPNLDLRAEQMGKCYLVDKSWGELYKNVLVQSMFALEGRHHNFIIRHNLEAQFLAEDAAGKR